MGSEAGKLAESGDATKPEASVSSPSQDSQKKRQNLPQKKSSTGNRDGYIDKGMQFLREVRAELRKVVWPSKKQTIGSTVVVIVIVMIISSFLGMVDMALSSLIRLVLQ